MTMMQRGLGINGLFPTRKPEVVRQVANLILDAPRQSFNMAEHARCITGYGARFLHEDPVFYNEVVVGKRMGFSLPSIQAIYGGSWTPGMRASKFEAARYLKECTQLTIEEINNHLKNDNYRTKCKFCGLPSLRWWWTEQGWRLGFPNGSLHNCLLHPANQRPTAPAIRPTTSGVMESIPNDGSPE